MLTTLSLAPAPVAAPCGARGPLCCLHDVAFCVTRSLLVLRRSLARRRHRERGRAHLCVRCRDAVVFLTALCGPEVHAAKAACNVSRCTLLSCQAVGAPPCGAVCRHDVCMLYAKCVPRSLVAMCRSLARRRACSRDAHAVVCSRRVEVVYLKLDQAQRSSLTRAVRPVRLLYAAFVSSWQRSNSARCRSTVPL